MGARKDGEQDVRSITQNSSGTYSVSLPIGLIRQLRWQRNQRVTIKKQGNKLVITDYKE
ncbi:hypothetical protein KC950_02835 [Candidatus Saccharibacteria bacterium]|nr:hypothetical protein [Candidatus Saccharibacteria bacterium]